MANKPLAVQLENRLIKLLLRYDGHKDGPCVDVMVLIRAVPNSSLMMWYERIYGGGMHRVNKSNREHPLRGRTHQLMGGSPRIAVLASSLKEWSKHYNPTLDPAGVDAWVDKLAAATRRLWQHKQFMSIKQSHIVRQANEYFSTKEPSK